MKTEHSPIGYKSTCMGEGHIPGYSYTLARAKAAAQIHANKYEHAVDIVEYTEPVPVARVEPHR